MMLKYVLPLLAMAALGFCRRASSNTPLSPSACRSCPRSIRRAARR
jgi:hypothetical protein